MCENCYYEDSEFDDYEDDGTYELGGPLVSEGDYVIPLEMLFPEHPSDIGKPSLVVDNNYHLAREEKIALVVDGAVSNRKRIVTSWMLYPPLPNVDQSSLAEEMGTSMDDMVLLDPADPFEAVLIDMVATNRKKRADYANKDDAFVNFRRSSGLLGIPGFGPKEAALHNITQKLARLQALREAGRMDDPKNESVQDTYLDLAVYAVILLALSKEENE
jgi:hypothetical protein